MALDLLDRKMGPLQFSEARAVRVKEPEENPEDHSAVYGSMAVYVGSCEESEIIMAAWPKIVAAAAVEAQVALNMARANRPKPEG